MKMSSWAVWGMVCLASCWCQPARAELPPWAYPDPNAASEIAEIEVVWASKNFRLFASSLNISRYKVEVVAKVREVHRTATGLKAGAKIRIRYDAHTYNSPGWCGPGSFPFLDKGAVYKAHLISGECEGVYAPWGAPYNAFEGKSEKRESVRTWSSTP
jgi:hypothetical protein